MTNTFTRRTFHKTDHINILAAHPSNDMVPVNIPQFALIIRDADDLLGSDTMTKDKYYRLQQTVTRQDNGFEDEQFIDLCLHTR